MGIFILEQIKEHFGIVFALVVVAIVLAVLAAYHIGKKLETLNNLPCQDHDKRMEEHRQDIKSFIASISELKGTMNSVLQSVTTMQQNFGMYSQMSNTGNRPFVPKKAGSYSRKQSPRQLNENGESLFYDVKGQKFIEDNREFLFEQIEKMSPKTAYDVEVAALTILRVNQNNDIFDGLKNWVYLAPSRVILDEDGKEVTTDVALDDVLFVISLPLRDAYLHEHPELVPEEIEEHQ